MSTPTPIDCPPYTVITPTWPTDPPAVWCDPHTVMVLAGLPETAENCALALLAAEDATWVLDTLTGGQYHGPEHWRDVYAMYDACRLALYHKPVDRIRSVAHIESCVTPDSPAPVPAEWCMVAANTISLCPGACGSGSWLPYISIIGPWPEVPWRQVCGCEQPHVMVEYDTKSTLPPGAAAAALRLATEKAKSATGKPCQLPERINTITRQGVTWTMFDPQDFLTAGLTGVSQVDSFIATAGKARPNVRIVDPLYGRMVSTELVGIVGAEPLGGPSLFNITVFQGDDFEMSVRFNTGDAIPEPIDITGWAFTAQIRLDFADQDPTVETEFTCSFQPGVNNVLIMQLDATQTIALTEGPYRYDLQSVDAGEVSTWLSGKVTVLPEVTR